jgi:hypothetical protein
MLIEKIQLEDDEDVLVKVRKHWFVVGLQLLGIVIVAILPFFLYVVARVLLMQYTELFLAYTSILIGLYAAWLLIMWMSLFSVWTNYYLDVWMLTNKRLVTADQMGLFNRRTGSFRLERLQDINVTVRGIVPTFLDYGNLEAQTASEDVEFVARNIPRPQEFKALILATADAITYNNPQPQKNNSGL